MRKILFAAFLFIALAGVGKAAVPTATFTNTFTPTITLTPTTTPRAATPANVSAGPLIPDGSANISWDEDINAVSWNFYLFGNLFSTATRSQTSLNGNTRSTRITNLPLTKSSLVMTMRSFILGTERPSSESAATTITAYRVPFSYSVPIQSYRSVTQIVQTWNTTPIVINTESYVGTSNTAEVIIGHDGACVDFGWALMGPSQTPVAYQYQTATAMSFVIPHCGPGSYLFLKTFQADCTSIVTIRKENP